MSMCLACILWHGHLSAKLIVAGQEADSYIAGQRAALMEAFQLMLPGQQHLGSMASNLQRIQSQVLASARPCPGDQVLNSGTLQLDYACPINEMYGCHGLPRMLKPFHRKDVLHLCHGVTCLCGKQSQG